MNKHLSVPQLLLCLVCIFHLFINTLWLSLNSQPLFWDQAGHTRLAIEFARHYQGTLRKDVDLINISSYYPPLTHLVISGFVFIYGPSVFITAFPITLYFVALLIGVFLLARKLSNNEWVAVSTTIFVSFFPSIYEVSHSFLLDIPLLTFLIYAWYFLLASELLTKRKYVLLFGLMTCAILLTKWIGLVLLIIPVGFVLYARTKKGWHVSHLISLGSASLIATLFSLPWYLANVDRLIEIGKLAAQGEITDPQGLLSPQNLLFYFQHILNFQLTLWPALIILSSIPFYLLNKKTPAKKILLYFFVFGYFLFTFISNKDIRYTIPLLPVLAFIPSYLLVNWWREKKYILALPLLACLLWLILQFFILSFHLLPNFQRAWYLGPLGWIDYVNTTDVVVKYPKKDETPNEAILKYFELKHRQDSISVMVGIDQPDINPSTLDLFIILNDYWQISLEAPYNITDGFSSTAEIEEYLSRFDYFLIPTGEVGPDAVRHKKALEQIRDYVIQQRGTKYLELKYFLLHTHPGEVLVFKHAEKT